MRAVVQLPGDVQVEIGVCGEDAIGVVQAGRTDLLQPLADQRPLIVVIQRTTEVDRQRALLARQGATGGVVQAATTDVEPLPAGKQTATGVAQIGGVQAQGIGADDAPLLAVVDLTGQQAEGLLAGNFA